MSKNKKQEIPMWARSGHSKPTSRREFLAHGLLPFAATLAVPNWLNLLIPSSASAATVCPSPQSTMIPFLTMHLSGGAGLMSNYVPMDQGGQMLKTYDLMGLGKSPVITREFGNVPFAGNGVSKFILGLRQTAPTAYSKTAFVALCSGSGDDRNYNKFSIDGLLAKAGLMGTMMPSIGTADTSTGIPAWPAIVAPPPPLNISRLADLQNAVGFSSALGNIPDHQKNKLAKLISSLSAEQTRKFASIEGGDQMTKAIDCAGIKNESLVKIGTSSVDLRYDSTNSTKLSSIWGVSSATSGNDENLIFGSVAYNVIKSQASSGGLTLSGFDYHDDTRTTGDAKDLYAGMTAGKILETAATLNKPVFILITTDGAVVSYKSDSADTTWRSDRGAASGMYILYFNPNGRPATQGFQIGHFTPGQEADAKFPGAVNTEAATAAVFANWLAANKSLNQFESIVPSSIFDAKYLDQVLKFG